MSPMEMVRQTAKWHPDHEILVTLHPRETYSPEEMSTLDATLQDYPLARISRKSPANLIPASSKIVTQNSSVAFLGLFFEKPVFLFARSDFHHIANNISGQVDETTFETRPPSREAFQKYLYWFLQENSINAGRDDVRARIIQRVTDLGWETNP